jgi:predicted MFS family arabinose efflux permease
MGILMLGHFALVPNLATYWQFNLGHPRERLGLLFVAGGLVSFVTMRLAGRLADRLGAAVTIAGGTAAYVAVLLVTFVFPPQPAPALLLFAGFMAVSSFRMVPMQALASRVPEQRERARFMSLQSVVQHLAAATGAFLASGMLRELPGGRLEGMGAVGWTAAAVSLIVPAVMWRAEARVRRREGEPSARLELPGRAERPREARPPRSVAVP